MTKKFLFSFLFLFLYHNTIILPYSYAFDSDHLDEAIANKIAKKFHHKNVLVRFTVDKDMKDSQSLALLDVYSVKNGKFTAKILLNGNIKTLEGIYEEGVLLPVLIKKFNKDELIVKNDVYLKLFNKKVLKSNILQQEKNVLGKMAKKTLLPNIPLKENDLKISIVIKKGSLVNLSFLRDNLRIETTGIAMDNGGIGDVIKIKVSDTNKIINGVVKDNKNVSILK